MASTKDNDATSKMTAIGIDLGSLHARIAINSSSSNSSVPVIVSSAQGGRYTLALSTPDIHHQFEEEESNEKKEVQFVFGEAARRSLQRGGGGGGGGGGENARLVRHLSTISVAGSLSSSVADNDDEFDKELKKEEESKKAEAKKAASAFFSHLATLACDATSSSAATLRVVLSVPNEATEELIQGIVQRTEEGVQSLIPAAEKKRLKKLSKSKKEEMDDNVVVAVLSDAAAVCVAHGIPKPLPTTSSSLKHVLVIDWGASGLSLTHLSHLGSSSILSTIRSQSSPSLSGTEIRSLLVKHCAQMFERKNRLPPNTILTESKKAKLKLQNVCEETLRTLSKSNSVPVTIDGLYDGLDLNVVISRPRFDVLCHKILRAAEEMLLKFAYEPTDNDEENKKRQNYDAVLLSGGVCQMISAKNLIQKIFPPSSESNDENEESYPGKCWRGNPSIPPEEAIAMGCAMHCSTLLSSENYHLLYKKKGQHGGEYLKTHPVMKEVPLSPVEISAKCCLLLDESPVVIIEEGTPLPANVTKVITLPKDKDTKDVTLDIVQTKADGEDTDIVVGKVDGIESLDDNASSIELTLELTKEGKLIMAVNGGESVTV